MEKANLEQRESFITADGSAIRELAGPAWTRARHQSLAEATLSAGGETAEHYHPRGRSCTTSSPGRGACGWAKTRRPSPPETAS